MRVRPSSATLASSALVLGLVDGLGLVDQHHRDALAHGVAAVQPGVVQRVLVGQVVEAALVLGQTRISSSWGLRAIDVLLRAR